MKYQLSCQNVIIKKLNRQLDFWVHLGWTIVHYIYPLRREYKQSSSVSRLIIQLKLQLNEDYTRYSFNCYWMKTERNGLHSALAKTGVDQTLTNVLNRYISLFLTLKTDMLDICCWYKNNPFSGVAGSIVSKFLFPWQRWFLKYIVKESKYLWTTSTLKWHAQAAYYCSLLWRYLHESHSFKLFHTTLKYTRI